MGFKLFPFVASAGADGEFGIVVSVNYNTAAAPVTSTSPKFSTSGVRPSGAPGRPFPYAILTGDERVGYHKFPDLTFDNISNHFFSTN